MRLGRGCAGAGCVALCAEAPLCCCAVAALLLFVCAVQQNLISTGAFEVYYDGRTLFSKLATGAPPQLPEIVRAVAEAHGARAKAQLAA